MFLHPAISPKALQLDRQVEDCWRWKEARDQNLRIEQLKSIEKEMAECTFKPVLCKESQIMARPAQVSSFRPAPRGNGPSDGTASNIAASDADQRAAPLSFEDFVSRSQGDGKGSRGPVRQASSSASAKQRSKQSTGSRDDVGREVSAVDFNAFLSQAAADELHSAEAPRSAPQAETVPRSTSTGRPKLSGRGQAPASAQPAVQAEDDHTASRPLLAGLEAEEKKVPVTVSKTPKSSYSSLAAQKASQPATPRAANGSKAPKAKARQPLPTNIVAYTSEFEDVFQMTLVR